MLVDPAIVRLRREAAPQPQVDAALAAWRAQPDVVAVLEALAAYGAGASLAAGGTLARLLADHAAALHFADGLIDPLMAASRTEPLAQLPLGFSAKPGLARLRLAQSGRAVLSLAVFARRAAARPASVLFEDGEAHELVLAGAGEAASYRIGTDGLSHAAAPFAPGPYITRKGADEARQIVAVTQPLLVLQLTREAAAPAPSREVALPNGALLQTISACKRSSQQMMALGVLGALAHSPALAAMEQLARDMAAARDLRWEALRQVLGLDTARGYALLAQLSARRRDALAEPAARLQRDLLAAYPELAALEPA
jgi:hypothetical protein